LARGRRFLIAAAALALTGAAAGPAVAAFPGVNGKIAFSRDGQIVVKDAGDLTGGSPLTSTGDNQDPAWSPDGLKIAFVSDRTGSYQVWTMNADGSNEVQLTSESGDTEAPAWSPDGARIAYGVGNGTDDDVVVRTVGHGFRLVVAGGAQDQDLPVFTADGNRVIFNDDAVGGLSIVGATGAGRANFLSDAAQADISPDGGRIVVRRTDIERLQVVNADGSGGTPILDYPATRPVWSPDGTRIIFHRSGFMGPASHLYVIPSGGAPSPTQESTPITLDFSADWQPIGAVPVITGFPQALVAGAPGATLLVDGRGFAHRSVVRWNGSNRPTTWLSPTRLSAQLSAADVAAPGNQTVTVFTSPSGGGLSAPATVNIPAPPPRILLSTSRLSKVKWVASRPRGTLRVAGTLEAAGRVEVALLRGRRVLQRQVFQLPAGAFSRTVKLGKRVLPGKLTLRLQGAGAGSNLVPVTREITIAAPPEGVTEAAFISALQRGPAASTLRNKSRIFATFRFAALPKGSRRITTRWIPPGRGPLAADGKPRRRTVTSFISSSGGLPTGIWRCEIRAGGKLVAVAKVRLR
jgi:WD40-like Beta Propeller Repeat